MPKRTDIKTILLIGSGPIIIGQACEFDYSGTQAVKTLKEQGYRVVLINSNPATIMTDPEFADRTYIEPIKEEIIAKIIKDENVDAILPTMGGQTALNVATSMYEKGMLEGIQFLGASPEAIHKGEDRSAFNAAMEKIGMDLPKSKNAYSVEEAISIVKEIGFPVISRASFTLAGGGSGVAYNMEEFKKLAEEGISASPVNEIEIMESMLGWKEYEMEVIRDKADNCIIVCTIENFDPMGVHTGDSITVAPALTLTDKEYQRMRNASFDILREIGVDTGGSNVQFSICPDTGRMIVIEMNPRVSRSSALASKATGYPIAKVATLLAVGYTLDEVTNDITGTPASFEPVIDYVVTKIPRFTFEKFPQADSTLTTAMKSVGEVMAMVRTFQESLQKALRGLEIDVDGLDPVMDANCDDVKSLVRQQMRLPEPTRLWYVADAMRHGFDVETLFELSGIDPWFLVQIEDLIHTEKEIAQQTLKGLEKDWLYAVKQKGFSDRRMATLMNESEKAVREKRYELEIHPVYKRVDSCAAEFESATAYMYSSYEEECEAAPTNKDKIIVLGGGPNRIGQGIEFDYCCVHAAQALSEDGYETIMVNCNPETVSTDYDTADRLYFESVTLEDVLEIIRLENPKGVIVQYGGQTPLKLARDLEAAGAPIIGTSPDSIDLAEDRERFQQLIQELGLLQPENATARTPEEAMTLAQGIGYPLVVRPSYVLGGRAMEIVYSDEELERYMREAVQVSNDSPVLLDHFLDSAIEVDVDIICDGEDVLIGGIMEHIEQAGVHSGDSACSMPPYTLGQSVQDKMRDQVKKMAKGLNVIGLMNTQFAIQGDNIYVLEVNPRASRTVPYVSKACGRPLAKVAARCMAGKSLKEMNCLDEIVPNYYAVKEAVFPFIKFQGVDPILGPEMKSTGEVMGVGKNFGEAYAKAQIGAGIPMPETGCLFVSVRDADKPRVISVVQELKELGFEVRATSGTAKILQAAGIDCTSINKVAEGRPHIVDMIKNGETDFIINTTEGRQAIEDSREIRKAVLQHKVAYTTTMSGAEATFLALKENYCESVSKLQDLHQNLESL